MTNYHIRKCEHLKYNQRNKLIYNYKIKNNYKINKYVKMKKLDLLNSKWWTITEENKNQNRNKNKNINNNNNKNNKNEQIIKLLNKNKNTKYFYMTYQKRLMYHNDINKILNKSTYLLNENIRKTFGIYYRYQPTILQYIQKSSKQLVERI